MKIEKVTDNGILVGVNFLPENQEESEVFRQFCLNMIGETENNRIVYDDNIIKQNPYRLIKAMFIQKKYHDFDDKKQRELRKDLVTELVIINPDKT